MRGIEYWMSNVPTTTNKLSANSHRMHMHMRINLTRHIGYWDQISSNLLFLGTYIYTYRCRIQPTYVCSASSIGANGIVCFRRRHGVWFVACKWFSINWVVVYSFCLGRWVTRYVYCTVFEMICCCVGWLRLCDTVVIYISLYLVFSCRTEHWTNSQIS